MNADRALSVALAACCLFALGASAATLRSSVDTTPDEAIDLSGVSLPLPADEARHLKQEIQSDGSGERKRRRPQRQSQSGVREQRQRQQSGSGTDGGGGSGGESGQSGGAPEKDSGGGGGPADPTLLERLLALLGRLFDLLVSLVPVAVVVGLVLAALRFRDRLGSLLARLRDRIGGSSNALSETSASGPGRPEPSNDVEAAWFEMVRRVGAEDEATRTPRDHAADAVEAGVDPDDAETLTSLFERVRYGGHAVTDARRDHARRTIQRVRAQLRGSEGR